MTKDFIQNRITELRIKKGVSEYKMSLDMGHSKGYIQSISSGKSLPSMPEFLYMCDYLSVTPAEFFDTGLDEPQLIHILIEQARQLDDKDLTLLISVAKRLSETP